MVMMARIVERDENGKIVKERMTDIECDCMCHEAENSIIHIIACCDKCPKCGANIKDQWFDQHEKICNGGNKQ